MEIIPCISNENPGYITKIEPSINPIITKYVQDFTNLNKILIKNKNSIPPIIRPIPIGNKKDKFKLEIADKYNSYKPSIISITVLLTPGITIPSRH